MRQINDKDANLAVIGMVAIVGVVVFFLVGMQQAGVTPTEPETFGDGNMVGAAIAVTFTNGWTPWLDRDNPSGVGDYEDLLSFRKTYYNLCEKPTAVECQVYDAAKRTWVTYTYFGQKVTCNTQVGFFCKNADNPATTKSLTTCKDYRVKFKCPMCGDGLLDAGEECDGRAGGMTCASFGYDGGVLACTSTCTYDTSGCYHSLSYCGDGVIDISEECDGSVGNLTCASFGYDGGSLVCSSSCMFDVSRCYNYTSYCGDGIVGSGEECDGNVAGLTCADFGLGTGTLSCDAGCEFDFSGCYNAAPSCNDSDGGINYYVRGTVVISNPPPNVVPTGTDKCYYRGIGYVDGCADTNCTIMEYYCVDANNDGVKETYNSFVPNVSPCTYGCMNGACINPIT